MRLQEEACHITISIEMQRIIAEINHHLASWVAAPKIRSLRGAKSSDETDAPCPLTFIKSKIIPQ